MKGQNPQKRPCKAEQEASDCTVIPTRPERRNSAASTKRLLNSYHVEGGTTDVAREQKSRPAQPEDGEVVWKV